MSYLICGLHIHTCMYTHSHTILTTQVSITAIQTVTKSILRRSGLFQFTVVAHHERRQELKARTKTGRRRRDMEKCCSLACFSRLLSLFSYTPRTPCLRVAPPIMSWTILHQSPIKKMPMALRDQGIFFQLRFLPLRWRHLTSNDKN